MIYMHLFVFLDELIHCRFHLLGITKGIILFSVRIIQPYSLQDLVNAERKVSFYVDCNNCPTLGVKYSWYLKYNVGSKVNSGERAHDLP